MSSKFNGVTYYGKLITHDTALELEDVWGRYPLSTNGMQSATAKKFVEDLINMPGIKVFMDYDEDMDKSDTVIIWDIKYAMSLKEFNVVKLIEIVCRSKPDECNQFEQDTIRLWWD